MPCEAVNSIAGGFVGVKDAQQIALVASSAER